MKPLKILIVMLVLIMAVGAACAEDPISDNVLSDDNSDSLETQQDEVPSVVGSKNTFTDFQISLNQTGDSLDVNGNYEFNNASDTKSGILIERNNFVINGNNHILDGNGQSRIFNITGANITICNLVLANGNAKSGGAIYVTGKVTLNNVTFISNNATKYGGAIYANSAKINCNNSKFIDNICDGGSSIFTDNKTDVNVYNTHMTSKITNKYSQIVSRKSNLNLDNLSFVNTIAKYCPAVYTMDSNSTIVNSRFENLTAKISAGAIAIKDTGNTYIGNCEFINTSSSKNAGAINADVYSMSISNVTISDTLFKDTSSSFGGAYIQLGGQLCLYNSTFTNSSATFNGGAVYISHVISEIFNCTFNLTGVEIFEGYPTEGGAIYSDASDLFVSDSRFINNTAYLGDAIYAHDSYYNISNTSFLNNENDIFTNYDYEMGHLDDSNSYSNNDSLSLNNTLYATIIAGKGMELTLLNNTIDVTAIPTKFDLRDWGWVSPVRDQGWMGACWAFGMTGALESALLKACGITTDFSENNMQNTMLQYSIYGQNDTYEGGDNLASSGYLLSWLGAFSQDADTYDEVGKISPVITTDNDVHIQDVIYIPN
ncbi:MAG: C1 family peptidase, partial [Methanobrevibacter sp.]|nr:C1 family peptidase [Methanobrevibacter sp.]